jgi:DNA-formamidopyrimidine glycosylase
MPEGDTILRTAENVGRWLQGRTVTEASSRVSGVDLGPVVGASVESVEAKGKHLLIRFSSGHVLHTHMRMTGAWHLYPAGERWRRPGWQARAILACGDRTAVCFNAPVVEMLLPGSDEMHPALAALGPDILSDHFDVDEVLARAKDQPPQTTAGELLLDQRVVAGIGNIYRCEALFAARINPWTSLGELDAEDVRRAVLAAARLMRTNVRAGTTMDRQFGGGPGRPWVYRRAGRPCQRCGTEIRHGRLGVQPRSVYWCPTCQGAGPASV